jgi:hypothetical protein
MTGRARLHPGYRVSEQFVIHVTINRRLSRRPCEVDAASPPVVNEDGLILPEA